MKKNKKSLLYLFLIVIFSSLLTLIIGIYSFLYDLTPKNYINQNTKIYYIKRAYNYFQNNEGNVVSINELIKKKYAKEKKELKEYNCDIKDSYIFKVDKNYYLHIRCKDFNATLEAIESED